MVPEEKFYIEHCESVNKTDMHDILCESRVYKNDEEIQIMRWASWITCEAHCDVMRKIRPG